MSQSEPRICFSDLQLQYCPKIGGDMSQRSDAEYVPFNRNNYGNDSTSVKISAFAACKSFMACGTFDGRILIYTYDDDRPRAELKMTTTFRITGLSFNANCTLLLASCFDCDLWLIELTNFQTVRTHKHGSKILDCAIDPECHINGPLSCVFIDNGGATNNNQNNKVIRLKPATSLFNRNSTNSEPQEISNNEVGLEKIVWQGDVIAWASSKSFTIYKNGQKTPYVPRSASYEWGSRASFLFSPNNDSLTVFFKGSLFEVTLSPKVNIQPKNSNMGAKKNVIIMARTPDFDARLIQPADKGSPPKIEFVSSNDCYEAPIPITGFDPNEFLCLTQGPNDIILALPWNVMGITRATQSEVIEFYLSNDRIETCFQKFRESQAQMEAFDRFQLVLKIIRHLLAKNDVDSCVNFCKDFATPKDWVEIIKSFEASNRLKSIAPIIPLDIPELTKEDVTKILRTMVLECPAHIFQEKFKHIMPNRYNASQLIGDISRQAEREPSLNESLMILQHSLDNHQNALQTALEIKHPSFFQDIEIFSQYDFVKKNFFKVLQIFPKLLPDFLMRHIDDLPPAKLLKKSNKALNRANQETTKLIEDFKLYYLDQLYKAHNPIIQNEEYGTELASLYIRNRNPETMKFLQSTTSYRLMEICREAESAQMYPEAAFLYYTAGSKKKGMDIHLRYINDAQKALDYAKQCDDKDVWKMISDHSYKNKEYLACMLDDLPNLNIKMKDFINKIPEDMKLDNFEELARKSLNEYKRKLRTAQLAYEIVSKDAFGAFKRSFETYKMGKKTQF
ncbi:hypothetical protein TRFO_36928 [Tritrichomonas foetus]|uniref:Uncharacterized protein n=1 Tax=Tritrichomonas foetus TaxID=1144522 RepID=A0A1J4JH43_9EUKA|nr:hypothetical protein TRFO_36928 [Tritrichomonas foetus]|eukprot:OHS96805.1 hypothetical protein TRFO_36928 [Tritrichomonas foetus]